MHAPGVELSFNDNCLGKVAEAWKGLIEKGLNAFTTNMIVKRITKQTLKAIFLSHQFHGIL